MDALISAKYDCIFGSTNLIVSKWLWY